ncbi:penicillin binding transpeptidase domain protein [Neorickettsia helminthoeca str. Oregon]|uniref:beta-lactamase n=1 Tax=Neorickettsia helminthoeca str. Oregon TaxID=1286528 RepID=X5HKP4_9RICK|nr:penicillin-binding transpeptidase domain-containing protein [Neorickettsia helminthoeca]AHX11629.1 penicillin binding transpeptidase domain protein [Neorickettsia helminthoeca str. Oregon]
MSFHDSDRRIFVLGGIGLIGAIAVSGRFFKLQILENEKYKLLSDQNRIRTVLVHGPRRIVVDCDRIEIAGNKKIYNITCTPSEIMDKAYILEWLTQVFDLSESETAALRNKIHGTETFIIKTPLGWQEISLLEFKSNQLQGIRINKEYFRTYPLGAAMAHIIGYTVYDSKEKKCKGIIGLEKLYESSIQRDAEIIKKEVDSRERYRRELERSRISNPDIEFKVSMSAKLHEFIYELISRHRAAVCIMEIPSGKIRAMVSSPSYDNNIFSSGIISQKQWADLNTDPNKPLLNRTISATFQPASTFKPIVGLAALESKIIDEEYTINCTGSIKIGNRKFHCWKRFGHGKVNLTRAIAESCNVYFYKIGRKISAEEIIGFAERFGLGTQTFTNMKEERYGILPDMEWRNKYLTQPLGRGDIINISIGHGYLSATPIQLAVMAARLATGRQILPTFDDTASEIFPQININHEHLATVRRGMLNTFSNTGTCRNFTSEMGKISGKTGTGQIRGRMNEDHFYRGSNSLFIGYTTNVQDTNHAISVVIEKAEDISASSVAVKALRYMDKRSQP